jgi:hypothetical protein
VLSFGVYKKQLFFYILLLPVLIIGLYFLTQHYSSASVINMATTTQNDNVYKVDVVVNKDSKVFVNGIEKPRMLFIGDNYDLLRYIAADEEGVYIEAIQVKLTLPKGAKANEIKPIIYGVHGVGDSSYTQVDNRTIIYNAYNLSPSATFTVAAQIPDGLVVFPFWQRFVYEIANMNVYWWLVVSFVPFALTLLYLLLMYYRTISEWRQPQVKNSVDQLPSNLAPAEVAMLVEGKVSSRAISAILVDLAHRNYINVINRNGAYSFGKRKFLEINNLENNPDLKLYEKVLLSKIFNSKEISTHQEDILFRVSHHVFSRKIAQVYIDIYGVIRDLGYFIKDPVKVYQKYRTFGLSMFFVSFVGLIVGLVLSIEPKFYLLFWLMLMFSSVMIIKMAPNLPSRNQLGNQELIKWLQFKNYLSSSSPIEGESNTTATYEKYLAYAIALGVEVEWAKRFSSKMFISPSWYICTEPVAIIEDFANGLYPIIGSVSRTLLLAREPII